MADNIGSDARGASSNGLRGDVLDELSQLFTGRVNVADGVLPPLVFVAVDAWLGLVPATIAGIGSALSIVLWRIMRGRALRFASAGLVARLSPFCSLFALTAPPVSSFPA